MGCGCRGNKDAIEKAKRKLLEKEKLNFQQPESSNSLSSIPPPIQNPIIKVEIPQPPINIVSQIQNPTTKIEGKKIKMFL